MTTINESLHQAIEEFEKAICGAIAVARRRNEGMYSLGTYHTLFSICEIVTSRKIVSVMADFRMELHNKGYFV